VYFEVSHENAALCVSKSNEILSLTLVHVSLHPVNRMSDWPFARQPPSSILLDGKMDLPNACEGVKQAQLEP
jgi:hypothetical protein